MADRNKSDPIEEERGLAEEVEALAHSVARRDATDWELHFPPRDTDPDRVLLRAADLLRSMDAERERAYKSGFDMGVSVGRQAALFYGDKT